MNGSNQLKFSLRDVYPSVMSVYDTTESTIPDSEESKAYNTTQSEGGTVAVNTAKDRGTQGKFFIGLAVVLLIYMVIGKKELG